MINMDLGTWYFPSGNNCDVSYEQDETGGWGLWCRWDAPPPLSAADEHHYMNVVIPEVVCRLRPFTNGGDHGTALYIWIT